jgi:hypothetical protein
MRALRVLLVANRTATDRQLIEAVRRRTAGYDEIILSTLPWRVSRWLRLDLPSKVRALGKPVVHVTETDAGEKPSELATAA